MKNRIKAQSAIWLGWLVALISLPLMAAPPALISLENGSFIIPLEKIQDSPMPLNLRGTESERSLSFPVSPRMSIQSADLDVSYTSSVSLQSRSQLSISLDRRILAQVPIRADQPDNAVRVSFTPQSLSPGYHDIGFHAAHHYTYHCEDSSAAELFTQIDIKNSQLRIQATRNPILASLAQLDALFDSRLWLNQFVLHIISTEPELLDAHALAAQGAALRLDFMPLHVHYSQAISRSFDTPYPDTSHFPGLVPPDEHDIILVGRRDTLAPLLSPKLLERIQGAYLGVFPLDNDPTRGVVVISGLDAAQVTQAAQVFALPGFALPDQHDMQIKELDLPQDFSRLPGSPASARASSQDESGWISFSRLGFATTTLHGMYPNPAELQFWAFSEMFQPRQRHLTAEVTFAYGAGFDKKSAINILLNGQFIQAIPLRDPSGAQVWRAKINIPIAQLKAGRNSLGFAPSVIGEDVGGECKPIFTDNLNISIADDSRIALPPNGGFMRLPDLSLLARTGLPYTKSSDGADSALLLLDEDDATRSAALTLLGKLAQVNKAALSALQLSRAPIPAGERPNRLMIGQAQALPEAIKQEVNAFLPQVHWQALAVGSRSQIVQATLQNWLSHLGQSPLAITQTNAVNASLNLESGLGQSAAAVQFQSGYTGGSIALFSAATPAQLQTGINQLVQFSTWGALNGNGMIWSPSGEPIAFSFPSSYSYIGDISPTTWLSMLLSDHPWLLLALALFFILLISFVSWYLLRRRAQQLKLEH
ncbi:MAG: hypothetical protein B7Y40_05470 [Gammaproteobacteria bacterium 28-57-27]|nr:MAG: hypothetical protein B7Y40_05470 [Gammaproteobacteria bacterium 28-57-27]